MPDIAVELPKISESAKSSIVSAFGLEKLLSTGLMTELWTMEEQAKRSKCEGLVYNLFLKITKDLATQNKPLPKGFTYDAVLDFYQRS